MKKIFYGWYIVLATIVMNCVGGGLFTSVLALFFPYYAKEFNFTPVQISLILTFVFGGALIATVSMPKPLKKLGCRKTIIISGAIYVAIFYSMTRVSSIEMIYATMAVLGFLSVAMIGFTVPKLITEWFDEKRGFAMGLAMTGTGVGPALMAPYISKTLNEYGISASYTRITIIVSFCVIFAAMVVRDNPESMGLDPLGKEKIVDNKIEQDNKEISLGLKSALKDSHFYLMLLSIFTVTSAATSIVVNVPSYLTELQYDYKVIGAVVSGYAMFLIAGKIIIGLMFDKIGFRKGVLVTMIGMIMTMVAMKLASSNIVFLYAYSVLSGLSFGIMSVAMPTFITLFYGKDHFNSIYSVMLFTISIAPMAGLPLLALIIQKFGYSIYLTSLIAIVMVSMLILLSAILLGEKSTNALKKCEVH